MKTGILALWGKAGLTALTLTAVALSLGDIGEGTGVPEIDPGSAGAAVAVAAGALAILRDRIGRR